jgi:hypothetical protein
LIVDQDQPHRILVIFDIAAIYLKHYVPQKSIFSRPSCLETRACVKFQKRTLILRIWSLQRFFDQNKYFFLCENQPQLLLATTVDSVMTLSAKLRLLAEKI